MCEYDDDADNLIGFVVVSNKDNKILHDINPINCSKLIDYYSISYFYNLSNRIHSNLSDRINLKI